MDIDYAARMLGIYNTAKKFTADAALINGSANLFYACGFKASFAYLLISPELVLITDSRYIESARERLAAICGPASSGYQVTGDELMCSLSQDIDRLGINRLAFVGDDVSHTLYESMCSGLGCELISLKDELTSLRMVKDEDEKNLLRSAVKLADDAFLAMLKELKPGISERKAAAKLKYILECSSEGVSFEPIVAFGKNSSMPHHNPNETQLRERDIILLDFGCRVGGYCSDMTRTVFMGEPDSKAEAVYSVVKRANELAAETVMPGARACDVDAAARDYISACGYGGNFGHGIGHGVGLDIHEYPVLNKTSAHELAKGMALTIEPGIYMEGGFGVRIEDVHIVGEGVLTQASKDIIVLNG